MIFDVELRMSLSMFARAEMSMVGPIAQVRYMRS